MRKPPKRAVHPSEQRFWRAAQPVGDSTSGKSPRTASSRLSPLIALAIASDELACSIRRSRTRTAGSLSLIAHRRTNTCASKKEAIRTGRGRFGRLAQNSPTGRRSLISPPSADLFVAHDGRYGARTTGSAIQFHPSTDRPCCYQQLLPISRPNFQRSHQAAPKSEHHTSWMIFSPLPCDKMASPETTVRSRPNHFSLCGRRRRATSEADEKGASDADALHSLHARRQQARRFRGLCECPEAAARTLRRDLCRLLSADQDRGPDQCGARAHRFSRSRLL